MSASEVRRRRVGVASVALTPVTLRHYEVSWLGPDLLAGLTLVAIALPEQMATARLVGMPAIAGLYAFIAGSLSFAVLGRHRQMSVGADSTIALVLAAGPRRATSPVGPRTVLCSTGPACPVMAPPSRPARLLPGRARPG